MITASVELDNLRLKGIATDHRLHGIFVGRYSASGKDLGHLGCANACGRLGWPSASRIFLWAPVLGWRQVWRWQRTCALEIWTMDLDLVWSHVWSCNCNLEAATDWNCNPSRLNQRP